ncbi:MAG: hypothetical protein AAF614_07850 [Chloroflexota bacterium]
MPSKKPPTTHYALTRYEHEWRRLIGRWEQHGEALIAAGFSQAEHDELLELSAARMAYIQEDPSRVRDVMETYVDPLLLLRGQKQS